MSPDSTRAARAQGRAAREAERGSRRTALPWIVVPAIIVVVFVIGFGLRLLL
jgi:hypothetical protein